MDTWYINSRAAPTGDPCPFMVKSQARRCCATPSLFAALVLPTAPPNEAHGPPPVGLAGALVGWLDMPSEHFLFKCCTWLVHDMLARSRTHASRHAKRSWQSKHNLFTGCTVHPFDSTKHGMHTPALCAGRICHTYLAGWHAGAIRRLPNGETGGEARERNFVARQLLLT
jgi:hypothetical protein